MKRTFLLSTILAAGLAAGPALAAGEGGYGQRTDAGAQTGAQAPGQYGQPQQGQVGQMDDQQQLGQTQPFGQQQQMGAEGGIVSQVVEDEQSVRQIQQALVQEGYNIQVDGIWGPNTQEAVRQYQREQGLQVDGLPGQETLQAMDLDQIAEQHTQTAETPQFDQQQQLQQQQQQQPQFQQQQQPQQDRMGTGLGPDQPGQGGATGIQAQ